LPPEQDTGLGTHSSSSGPCLPLKLRTRVNPGDGIIAPFWAGPCLSEHLFLNSETPVQFSGRCPPESREVDWYISKAGIDRLQTAFLATGTTRYYYVTALKSLAIVQREKATTSFCSYYTTPWYTSLLYKGRSSNSNNPLFCSYLSGDDPIRSLKSALQEK